MGASADSPAGRALSQSCDARAIRANAVERGPRAEVEARLARAGAPADLAAARDPSRAVAESAPVIASPAIADAAADLAAAAFADVSAASRAHPIAVVAACAIAESVPELAACAIAESVPDVAACAIAESVPDVAACAIAESVPDVAACAIAESVPDVAACAIAESVPELATRLLAIARARCPAQRPGVPRLASERTYVPRRRGRPPQREPGGARRRLARRRAALTESPARRGGSRGRYVTLERAERRRPRSARPAARARGPRCDSGRQFARNLPAPSHVGPTSVAIEAVAGGGTRGNAVLAKVERPRSAFAATKAGSLRGILAVRSHPGPARAPRNGPRRPRATAARNGFADGSSIVSVAGVCARHTPARRAAVSGAGRTRWPGDDGA